MASSNARKRARKIATREAARAAAGPKSDQLTSGQVTQRRLNQRALEVVYLCDDELEYMDSDIPLPQAAAGPSTTPAQHAAIPSVPAPLQPVRSDAGPEPDADELTVACTSEYAEYRVHAFRRTPEHAEDEAQFSDAEDGPPTPSAATRAATLLEENGSFALSGVVAADAWQADR